MNAPPAALDALSHVCFLDRRLRRERDPIESEVRGRPRYAAGAWSVLLVLAIPDAGSFEAALTS
ncbi:hypothetical protein XH98_28520 [Bradyrhizobium sp. CCBAU 51745]|nr:hypothetical protein [Bradyrhizobium sp. CCBAU 51745]